MENTLISLPLAEKKLIANNILLKYHRRYRERTSSMYYHWTDIKCDKNNGGIILVKCSSHDYSPHINEDTREYIDEVLTEHYDEIMKTLMEHIDDFNDSPLGFVFNDLKKVV